MDVDRQRLTELRMRCLPSGAPRFAQAALTIVYRLSPASTGVELEIRPARTTPSNAQHTGKVQNSSRPGLISCVEYRRAQAGVAEVLLDHLCVEVEDCQ